MSVNKYLQEKLGLLANPTQLITGVKETYEKSPSKALNFIRPLVYYEPCDRTLIACLISSNQKKKSIITKPKHRYLFIYLFFTHPHTHAQTANFVI